MVDNADIKLTTPTQEPDSKVSWFGALLAFMILFAIQWQMSRNRAALAKATTEAAQVKEDLEAAREKAGHQPVMEEARKIRERIIERKESLDELYRKMDRLDVEHTALSARADLQRKRIG
jgi:hypothetical protein